MNKRTAYNNLHNEGGDGYNPYTHRADLPSPRTRSDILRDLECEDSDIARECGTYSEARVAMLRAELAVQDTADHAALGSRLVAAGWVDADTTHARRLAWNEAVKALGKRAITHELLASLERRMGYTFADLKAAKAYYGVM
jgi:hypothetical protein